MPKGNTAAAPEAPLDCPLCPRLFDFRTANAKAHPDWFNAPVPSFGDTLGRLLIVGLAPGLQGANRTGRPFTGDYAGDLLYSTLDKFGLSTGTYQARPDDGLKLKDAMKAKKLREALQQMAEEGVVQIFIPNDGSGAIVGVVGALQLDVLQERLQAEYSLPVAFETSRFELARWISSEDKAELEKFVRAYPSSIAMDLDQAPVFLAQSAWALRYEQEKWPAITFSDVKDYQKKA